MSDSASKHRWVLDVLGINIGEIERQPAQATAFDPSHAKVGTPIKRGQFGLVNWLNTDQPDMPRLVLKTPLRAEAKAELEREEQFYRGVGDHPNIAKCFGMQTVDGQEGLVLEGIKGRDMAGTMQVLDKLRTGDAATLKKYGMTKQLSQEEFVGTLQYIAMQTLAGLAYLEQTAVVHNDIRPDNIMIDQETGAVKIVDFGISQPTGGAPGERHAPVTHGSVSPDRAGTEGMTPKHDMFGLGEVVRKPMERGQFRYLTDKKPDDLGMDDARAFGAPDSSGAPKQALNAPAPGAATVAPFAARLAPLIGRAETALGANNGFLEQHCPEGRALRVALNEAQETMKTLETSAAKPAEGDVKQASKEMNERLAALVSTVEAAEATNARYAVRDSDPGGARLRDLKSRLDKLLADPFIKGSETGNRLQVLLGATQATDAVAMDAMDKELQTAEATLKRSGQFGAETAYTRFVNVMMHPDPKERPSARELLAIIQSLDGMDDNEKKAALERIDPVRPAAPGNGKSPLPVRFLAQRMSNDTRSREILRNVLGQAAVNDAPAAAQPVQPPPQPLQQQPAQQQPAQRQPTPEEQEQMRPYTSQQPTQRQPTWEELEKMKPYTSQ